MALKNWAAIWGDIWGDIWALDGVAEGYGTAALSLGATAVGYRLSYGDGTVTLTLGVVGVGDDGAVTPTYTVLLVGASRAGTLGVTARVGRGTLAARTHLSE